jgi:GNAT superfamily N-acetyltransferase
MVRAMSEFLLREAAPGDEPMVRALLSGLADYEKLQDRFHLTESAITRDMLGDACHCVLAFQDQTAAGIATWFWTYKSFRGQRGVFVEDLYVKPEFRGRGLGRKLLAHLARRARQANGFLGWQVLDWNESSIEFYKSLGATLSPEWITCRLQGAALERLS